MNDQPMTADGVHLHILGDESVLFDEASQCLFRLNTSATFLWCLLQDGLGYAAIVDELRRTFEISKDQAEAMFTGTLKGFRDFGVLKESERVIASSSSRLYDDDRGSFPPSLGHLPILKRREYRLLGSIFSIGYGSSLAEDLVCPVLIHLQVSYLAKNPIMIDIVSDGAGFLIFENGRRLDACRSAHEIVPLVKAGLTYLALQQSSYFIGIHAAAITAPAGCLLLPAKAGSGKSTLTAACIAAGLAYASDDMVVLENDTFDCTGINQSLCIKQGSWDLLASRFPELSTLTVHRRPDGELVRYLPPPQYDSSNDAPRPVRWIVFPTYCPGAETVLQPMSHAEGLQNLMMECCAVPELIKSSQVGLLVHWIQNISCYQLLIGNIDDAVRTIHGICNPD